MSQIVLELKIEEPINLVPGAAPSVVKGDRGLSAYEVAVDNGFEGDELQWLESLKKAAADHDHEVGNLLVLFENKIV